jgi:AcrR family transcriptional regulator
MSEQQILQASLKLFARYGYDYVSVRQIAGEANVNIGSISYYFQNKIGILQRIIDDFYKGMNLAIRPIIDDVELTGYESIQKLARAVIENMYANLDASRIVVREISLETERFEDIVKKHNKTMSNCLIDFFARLGIKQPRQATLKFTALTRFPFANPDLIEYYLAQPFSPRLFEDYTDIVLSSLANELSI